MLFMSSKKMSLKVALKQKQNTLQAQNFMKKFHEMKAGEKGKK